MIKVGAQLKYYREKNQLTQKEVAAVLHITPQTISKWERDKSYPDIDQLVNLSELYNVNVNKLLGRSKPGFLDYLSDAQNFRNYYGIPTVRNDKNDQG